MSDNTFTENTSESWWQRIKASLTGSLFGLALFLVAFPLLFWNEGRDVDRNQALQEGMDIVVSINAKQVDAANENKLVHISGYVTSDDALADETFGVIAGKVIKLRRTVKMYQWKETSHSTTKEKFGEVLRQPQLIIMPKFGRINILTQVFSHILKGMKT